jgi:hypothetical protein
MREGAAYHRAKNRGSSAGQVTASVAGFGGIAAAYPTAEDLPFIAADFGGAAAANSVLNISPDRHGFRRNCCSAIELRGIFSL